MEIRISIKKRHLWLIMGAMVLLFGVTIAIAKTTTLVYENAADKKAHEVLYTDIIAGKTGSTVVVDDNLEGKGYILAVQLNSSEIILNGSKRNSWPTLDCIIKSEYNANGNVVVRCDAGYSVVGGGWDDQSGKSDDTDISIPTYDNGWRCLDDNSKGTCYAVCCRIV